MKAKYLMMAIFGAALAMFCSCSDDPANDYKEGAVNEVRQLKLSAVNLDNECTAVSSENPSIAEKTVLARPTGEVDEEGEPVYKEYAVANKPTDVLLGLPGDSIQLNFAPGLKVTSAEVTLTNNETITLDAEKTSYTYALAECPDSTDIKAVHVIDNNGVTWKYTGTIYVVSE